MTRDNSNGLPLTDLGILAITGADAARFLQGYLTSDTEALEPQQLQPTALCSLKGRVLANGYALVRDEAVWLILHCTAVPLVAEFLKKYLMFSKSRALDLSADWAVVGCTSDTPDALALDGDCAVLLQAAPPPDAPTDADLLNAWNCRELRAGRFFLPASLAEQFLPQMLGLHEQGAVSFSKGCYLGQEVVARAQHRGAVKRSLRRLQWQGAQPTIGADLIDGNGARAGTLVALCSLADDRGLALAVTTNDARTPFHGPADTSPDTGTTRFEQDD